MKTLLINQFGTQTESELLLEEQVVSEKQIILYDDPVNTFDFVIESLIKVCKHDVLQAEQCTYLVHYTGKCAVKQGSYEVLKPICIALLDRGLTVAIE